MRPQPTSRRLSRGRRGGVGRRVATTSMLTALLLSCPPTAKVAIFNHTPHAIVVTYFDSAASIAAGESRELRIHGHGGPLVIYFQDGRRDYALHLRDVPSERFRSFWGGLYRVQLEEDRRIFILERGQRSPQPTGELPQPHGFPLEPEPTASSLEPLAATALASSGPC